MRRLCAKVYWWVVLHFSGRVVFRYPFVSPSIRLFGHVLNVIMWVRGCVSVIDMTC